MGILNFIISGIFDIITFKWFFSRFEIKSKEPKRDLLSEVVGKNSGKLDPADEMYMKRFKNDSEEIEKADKRLDEVQRSKYVWNDENAGMDDLK